MSVRDKKLFIRYGVLALALWSMTGLNACMLIQQVEKELFDTRTANLTESSYAATDMLATQTRDTISAVTPVRVVALTDTANPEEITPFGQQIANSVASRLVQLGYNVRSYPDAAAIPSAGAASPVSVGSPQPVQTGIAPGMSRGQVMIGGTYTRTGDSVLMSLRAVQENDHRMVGAYDYTLPLTHDVRNLALTRAEREKREKGFFGAVAATPVETESPVPQQNGTASGSPQPLMQTQ